MIEGSLHERGEKFNALCRVFAPLIGATLSRYETAQLEYEPGKWDDWPDFPIRFYFGNGQVVSIAWNHSEELWIRDDLSYPFSPSDLGVRWIENSLPCFSKLLGQRLVDVALGTTLFSGLPKMWDRIFLCFDSAWVEVFLAGDENAYRSHTVLPEVDMMHIWKNSDRKL